jgi:hypothetical protein
LQEFNLDVGGFLTGATLCQYVTLPGTPCSLATLPYAGGFLVAFVSGSAPTDVAAAPTQTTASINTSQLLFNDGAILGNPIGSQSLYAASTSVNIFPAGSTLASKMRIDPDFQELISETLQAHKADVISYFNANPGAVSYAVPSPGWQAIGCWQVSTSQNCPNIVGGLYDAPTFFSTASSDEVDKPPLFPCPTLPGVECDLTFGQTLDLQKAFGRVGYNFVITALITRSPSMTSWQYTATNVTISASGILLPTAPAQPIPAGYIYDVYQWDPTYTGLDYLAADVQAGFNTLGFYATPSYFGAGQIFQTVVMLDTPLLLTTNGNVFIYAFQ